MSLSAKMPGEFQVQEGLPEGTKFCNVQYYDVDGAMKHGPLTLQRLDGNEHAGNIFPSGVNPDLVQPHTDKLSIALHERGMRGTWAYDVAVTPDNQVYLIEMNPRWNGASYYSYPAERLKAGAWEGISVKVTHDSFDFMFRDPHDWEFNPSHNSGIVIINWATIVSHKLGLLVIGTPEQRASLLETFQNRFC